MKKQKIALIGAVALVGVLASCGSSSDKTTTKKDLGTLDVYVNYSGTDGITLRSETFYNSVESKTYTKGELLPTWKEFASKVGVTIREASSYQSSTDNDTYTAVKNNNYASDTDATQKIDLFYNTTSNINTMGAAGECVDLSEHLDEMPNFKAWTEKNPTLFNQIKKGSAFYYTPYCDGYNDIEKMFIMDTEMVSKVLAADANYDTTTKSGKGADSNALQYSEDAHYTSFIDANGNAGGKNLPTSQLKVSISVNATAKEVTLGQADNIITQQNALLAQGCTGEQLGKQFYEYMNTVYGGLVKDGTYSSLADAFISESAAYNVDELIALMRVIKANPGLITGDSKQEVEIVCPRGQANNRVDNILDLLQMWGIQGTTSEKDNLYFAADGTLNCLETTAQTYEGLEYLHEMYSEGLIHGDFYKKGSKSSSYYLNKYFAKTDADYGYGFMLYDYAASTGASNDMVDGIGTDPKKRKNTSLSVTGVRAVLSPMTYWATGEGWNASTGSLTDFSNKTLFRFSDDNRGLKSNSWCIPASTDNLEGALALMDYMFSEEGSAIQDFGPTSYYEVKGGYKTPTSAVKALIAAQSTDFFTCMRRYIGSTHGIGHIRSEDIQIASCNSYAAVGLTNVENAIKSGVLIFSNTDQENKYAVTSNNKSGKAINDSVPSAGYETISNENAKTYDAITSFFNADKCSDTASGWVLIVQNGVNYTQSLGTTKNTNNSYTFQDVKGTSEQTNKNKVYLYTMAGYIGRTAIPSYANQA